MGVQTTLSTHFDRFLYSTIIFCKAVVAFMVKSNGSALSHSTMTDTKPLMDSFC